MLVCFPAMGHGPHVDASHAKGDRLASKKLKYWFDKALAILLAEKIQVYYPRFDADAFVQHVAETTRGLELKDRVERIADALREHLPRNYSRAVAILISTLGPENSKESGMFSEGYWIMPLAKYVEKYGLAHYSESINAIMEITKRHTGEYSIRPFLQTYPNETLAIMKKWSLDPNVHVRRLASEGIRPRLPWASKLDQFIDHPEPMLEILDNLKDDESKFVLKSVANAMNDMLKDNYSVGMAALRDWAQDASPNRQWMIRHALRNHLKQGNPEAIRIIETFEEATGRLKREGI
jgi:3-methyladenine DNA glycosylase AlkC